MCWPEAQASRARDPGAVSAPSPEPWAAGRPQASSARRNLAQNGSGTFALPEYFVARKKDPTAREQESPVRYQCSFVLGRPWPSPGPRNVLARHVTAPVSPRELRITPTAKGEAL